MGGTMVRGSTWGVLIWVSVVTLADCPTGPNPNEPSVGSVAVDKPSVSLAPGETSTITVRVRDPSGNHISQPDITVVSSAPTVATADPPVVSQSTTYTIRAVSGGTATLTFEAGGKSATVVVTVANGVPVLTSLDPAGIVIYSPTTPLNVGGTGFVPGSVLRLNAMEAATTFVDGHHLTASVTPELLSNQAGAVQ